MKSKKSIFFNRKKSSSGEDPTTVGTKTKSNKLPSFLKRTRTPSSSDNATKVATTDTKTKSNKLSSFLKRTKKVSTTPAAKKPILSTIHQNVSSAMTSDKTKTNPYTWEKIKNQLSKPVVSNKTTFSTMISGKKKNHVLSTFFSVMKYVICALLFFAFIISMIYFILYMRDYSRNNNTPTEKNTLKYSIIKSVLCMFIAIILLVITNSYWKIVTTSFSVPISMRFY